MFNFAASAGNCLVCLVLFLLPSFRVTRLAVNFIGNQITLEALATGTTLGVRAASVLMWLSCMNAVISSDKVVYLFGRISPNCRCSFPFSLRAPSHGLRRTRKVHTAQKAIGRGINQGPRSGGSAQPFPARLCPCHVDNGDMIETAASMKCRGYR